jgi:trans-aconitate methyltransferase
MSDLTTSWNPELYDTKHGFVSQYGGDIVQLLAPWAGERILDLGCGTGDLSHTIAAAGAQVIGIDNSAEMIREARQKYPSVTFEQMDGADFHFAQPFDAVFSNAALHWMLEKEKVVACIRRALRPGGRLVAEMGGKGNVLRIRESLRKVLLANGYTRQAGTRLWYFPSLGEYATLLEKEGFRVTYAVHFDRETQLADQQNGIADWLEMFARLYFTGIPAEQVSWLARQVQEELRPACYRDGHWYADYKRLRITAIREE